MSQLFKFLHVLFPDNAGLNRRMFRRHARVTYIEIQPLNEEFNAVGEADWGITRDISRRGVGFIIGNEVTAKYVRLTMREDDFTAIAEIKHQSNVILEDEPIKYYVGARFIDESYCHYRQR